MSFGRFAFRKSRVSARWFERRHALIWGASLDLLCVGEKLALNSAGGILSWPASVGPSLLPYVSLFTIGKLNGRKATTVPVNNDQRLRTILGSPPVMFLFCVKLPAIPWVVARSLADTKYVWTPGYEVALGINGTTTFYEGGGWNIWVDGVDTPQVTQGNHVIHSAKATNDGLNFTIGRDGLVWAEPLGCVIATSAMPSGSQLTDSTRVNQEYYGFRA